MHPFNRPNKAVIDYHVFVPLLYPDEAPILYVNCWNGSRRARALTVFDALNEIDPDDNYRTTTKYLKEWSPASSTLLGLGHSLREEFMVSVPMDADIGPPQMYELSEEILGSKGGASRSGPRASPWDQYNQPDESLPVLPDVPADGSVDAQHC